MPGEPVAVRRRLRLPRCDPEPEDPAEVWLLTHRHPRLPAHLIDKQEVSSGTAWSW